MGQAPNTIPPGGKVLTYFVDEEVKGALGGLPVAEQNEEYFAVFKQVGGTGPEIIGQTAYFLTYLVDANGNVSKPADDTDALSNLIQTFPAGKTCVVRQDAASALNSILAGEHAVAAIGRQQPILYTQTGFSTGSFNTSISFSVPGGTVSEDYAELLDYRGKMNLNNSSSPSTIFNGPITNYDSVVSSPNASAATFNITNGTYTLTPDSDNILTSITFKVTFKVGNFSTEEYGSDGGSISLYLERNSPSDPQLRTEFNFELLSGEDSTFDFSYTADGNELEADDINPVFYLDWQAPSWFKVYYINFEVSTQNPSPGTASGTTGNYWTANYSSKGITWLTGSAYLSQNYGNIQDSTNILNASSTGFNLSPIITPFKLQVGDRIRFEYNPRKEYFIYEVIEPSKSEDGLLKIKINKFIPEGTETDNFIIHRTDIKDPAYIILDVDKNDDVANTQDFNGILLPKYPSKRLKNNLDNILIDLKEKGIITDNQS